MAARWIAHAEEEEAVDPRIHVREHCTQSHCLGFSKEFNACQERVKSKAKTTETCTQELFQLLHCVDHCATKDLFKHLK
eukprot:m.226090 g.226090  ORF g.226090 m.226090 type:complete len:79 (-) comp11370_c0_seq1:63-299(-)